MFTSVVAAIFLVLGDPGGPPGGLPPSFVVPSESPAPALGPVAATAIIADPPPPPAADYVTHSEMQAELTKRAWTKGDIKVVPYGTIWGNAAYDTQRSRIGDYCLWIESQSTHPDEDAFSVDAKSTRIGIDITGPGLACFDNAPITGKVEVDFQGPFVTRNKPGLLLRHAYVETKNDEYRILIGQTWDVMSPLYIPTLNYTAGSAVGNLAYRRAQFRLERFFDFSDQALLTLQGSINANVVTDFVSDPTVSADVGPYPDVQARAAITLGERKCPDARPFVLGIGGHFGEQDFDFRAAPLALDIERNTWSVNSDLVLPITQRLGFQGEFFTGENLSNYMGGILQGVDRITHRGIRASGGWFDIYCDWRTNFHTHVGFAIDDPLDRDLTSGRTCNQMIFANAIWEATKQLQLGLEVDVWKTLYLTQLPGDDVRIEFAAKYRF